MKQVFKIFQKSQKAIKGNLVHHQTIKHFISYKYDMPSSFNCLSFQNKYKFTSNFGESDLKNLSQILKEHSGSKHTNDLYTIQKKVENIKFNLTKLDKQLVQEFHQRLVDYYTQQKNLCAKESDEQKKYNALILQEHIQLYYAFEELEFSQELKKLADSLVKIFDETKDKLIFQTPQIQFDYLYSLSQIFGFNQKDDQQFETYKLIEEKLSQELKQVNYEKYLESLCERVTLSQVTRNHDQVFEHLNILFKECQKINIPTENEKILTKINQYFLRGILLSTQFDKPENQAQYEQFQKEFVEKYNYQPSNIEKLTLQVKEISLKTPNYIQVKGEQVTSFIENHKLEFSSQVQDILIYQLYNQVVPLNLFEYFYMLVKFESNYREEIEEIPTVLETPDELVEDFEDLIVSNIQTLLEIRKLIKLFTKEVIEIDAGIPYQNLEISTWISRLKPKYQSQIKEIFKKQGQTYN